MADGKTKKIKCFKFKGKTRCRVPRGRPPKITPGKGREKIKETMGTIAPKDLPATPSLATGKLAKLQKRRLAQAVRNR